MNVVCDECGISEEFDVTEYAGDGSTQTPMFGVESSTLEDRDWTMRDGETFCPDCAEANGWK